MGPSESGASALDLRLSAASLGSERRQSVPICSLPRQAAPNSTGPNATYQPHGAA
jgi:hypothetical protein